MLLPPLPLLPRPAAAVAAAARRCCCLLGTSPQPQAALLKRGLCTLEEGSTALSAWQSREVLVCNFARDFTVCWQASDRGAVVHAAQVAAQRLARPHCLQHLQSKRK